MSKINNGDLADNLIALRGAAGLSQRELAHRAGIAGTQLSRYETGRSRPRSEVLASLARALNVPIDALHRKVNACPARTTINDGGPAFPFVEPDTMVNVAVGMSLRDYFAAKAVQGWLASFGPTDAPKASSVAIFAYSVADAMLAARGDE